VNPPNNTWVSEYFGKIATIANLATNQRPTLYLKLRTGALRHGLGIAAVDRRVTMGNPISI
jgi:hypothetical protein